MNIETRLPSEEEVKEILGKQSNLAMQSFETLKTDISPNTFEIMSRQATMNIGMSKYKMV